ncbi:TIGR02186 family protein [Enterovirga rhinocerotis]|uniref:Uncharacterized protein (TIGR02186 family) n=1 Tax=Enterovirga rhinocerotis TaxID=1339210 RepID=A0A4R7C4E9_9HYPH|nr:TIGR02186 family protein [Enterovirga rhinocerotis]TDR93364.1 uncharacterized protein (TIGR02186 family) [Enterovirga rhinocerotis]
MTFRILSALLLAAMGLLPALPAKAERLMVSLSAHQIAIGSNYTGAQMALFGVVEDDGRDLLNLESYDVVVTVRGPREGMTVRQKERVGFVWINRSQQKFVAVPTVLAVASNRPTGEIATDAARRQMRLGLRAIVDAPEMSFESHDPDEPFRQALIRLKTKEGHWSEDPRGVVFVGPGFFRAPISVPGTAPTGNYEVEVVLLSGDRLAARRIASFEVVKTGFEERITALSQERSLPYGLGIGAMSLLFGWMASVIFRRD